jgi:YHS domain-containing protein
MGWLLRFILLLVIVRAVWRLLAGVFQGLHGLESHANGPKALPLVQDPVCGTFVVPSRALTLGRGDSVLYFCSERCLTKYRSR